MDLPTIRQLEYFVAVADTLSFREAARECHVTQPALSAQVQQLEDQLGLLLFERDRRRVLLTRSGESLAERARQTITAARNFVEQSRVHRGPLAGSLCLGAIPTVAPYLLPPVFGTVNERFPDLELHLCEDQTEKITRKLSTGDLDLILLSLDSSLSAFETVPLFEDRFHLCVPRHHPLTELESVGEDDLVEHRMLLLSDGHCLRDQVIEVCQRARVHQYDTFRAGSLTTLVQMVASGIGITLLPCMALELEARLRGSNEVTIVPFHDPVPSRPIGLAFRPDCPRADEFRLFGSVIVDAFRSTGRRRGEQVNRPASSVDQALRECSRAADRPSSRA